MGCPVARRHTNVLVANDGTFGNCCPVPAGSLAPSERRKLARNRDGTATLNRETSSHPGFPPDFANEPPDDANRAIAAVFRLLDRHLSAGEITQVRNTMKKQLRQLWPTH